MQRSVILFAVATGVLTACGPGAKSEQTAAGEVALPAPAIVPADLMLFATLPAVMASDKNPVTDAKVSLGRMLYYETTLSDGHDVSCNTCHPLNGWGADGRTVSFGHEGKAGTRNAPTVYNAAGQFAQFWDGRAATVEEQAKGPILNPVEMGMPNAAAVLEHVRASAEYQRAFKAAFPGERDPVTYDNVGRAIGAFERKLTTPSAWDRFQEGDAAALTDDAKRGFTAFVGTGCQACHNGAYVGGTMFQKVGLVKAWPTLADSGRYRVTKQPADLFLFKVPSLRNVEKTGPYFHDGSVAQLTEAIRLMARHQLGKELSTEQAGSIAVWLKSLTGEIPTSYIALPQLPAQ